MQVLFGYRQGVPKCTAISIPFARAQRWRAPQGRCGSYIKFGTGSAAPGKPSGPKQQSSRFSGPQPVPAQRADSRRPTNIIIKPNSHRTREQRDAVVSVVERISFDEGVYPAFSLAPINPLPDNDLSSTRPAPLDQPEAPDPEEYGGTVPTKTRASYLWELGKAYGRFYKTGLKNVWANYKQARQIRHSDVYKGENPAQAALYSGQRIPLGRNSYGGRTSEPGEVDHPKMSRKEFQLLLRSRHDIKKLVPFTILFAIFGEWLPLVIVFIGSPVVPYTCRIPQQVLHDYNRHSRNHAKYLRAMQLEAEAQKIDPDGQFQPKWYYGNLSASQEVSMRQMFLISYRLALQLFSTPPPIIGPLLWKTIVINRLRQHHEEMLADMVLIRREGGFARLAPVEVFDFAYRHYSPGAMAELTRRTQAGIKNELYGKETKDALVPLLERHADAVLSHDYTRMSLDQRWLAVYATQ